MEKVQFLTQSTTLPVEVGKNIKELQIALKELKNKEKELNDVLLKEMENNGILSIENDDVKLTYVAPYFKESFDSKKLQADNKTLYDKYVKISEVKASIRITLKGDK